MIKSLLFHKQEIEMTTLARTTLRWLPLLYVVLAVTALCTISIMFSGQ